MAPAPRYVFDLLASSETTQTSLATILERLNAIEEQNRELPEQLHQQQLQSHAQQAESMTATMRFPVHNRTNPSQGIETFFSEAFTEKILQELKRYYKDFSSLALQAYNMYSEQENNHCTYNKKLPSKGKITMKRTCFDFLLEKHEDLFIL